MSRDRRGEGDAPSGKLPGLELNRLNRYVANTYAVAPQGPLKARLLPGGMSNLTYEVTDGHNRWVVRRPPLGHVLDTAHDMRREFRVISALHGTGVPVPRAYLMCEDPSIIGAPFYVMELLEGKVYRSRSDLAKVGEVRTRKVSIEMVDILATLHRLDPSGIGLSKFGKSDGFLSRQVQRWKKQLDASRSHEIPGADELYANLEQNIPPASEGALIHGDYRLNNLIFDEQDRVAGVLDWEMSTIGEPLTDVALLLVYQQLGDLDTGYAAADAASAPGFLRHDEVLERYAMQSGRDCSNIGFYIGLAHFKLAAILAGIHYRYLQGQTLGEGFENVGTAVGPLVEAGLGVMRASS